jgi:hypothetical protein
MLAQPRIVKFEDWAPDRVAMEAPVVQAKNVVPSSSGFRPFKDFVAVSSALGARPRGAIQTRDDSDAVFQFAGDATKLYQNVSDTWTDRSLTTYATAAADNWEFARWRNTVIATNYTDNPQTITLGDTAFANLTTTVKFKHVAIVRAFAVAGYTNDTTDGEVPWRVRWSAFGDTTDWDPDPATLSDYEDLPQKKIQRVFGGEYGVIMQDEAITRMTFVGSPAVFQFDETVPEIGLIAPGAACQSGDVIYFLSTRGFFRLVNGQQLQPIGIGRVDQWMLEDLDQSALERMSCIADPTSHRILWLYPGSGNNSGTPNKIIIYDTLFDKWSYVEIELELLWQGSGSATTLEDLDTLYGDLDAMTVSLDSPIFIGGATQLSAFGTAFKSGYFTGDNLVASLITREMMLDTAHKSRVGGMRCLVEGDAVTLRGRLGSRNDHAAMVNWTDYRAPRTGGRFPFRQKGRYHRLELEISGNWSQAAGVMIDGKDMSLGGRRG